MSVFVKILGVLLVAAVFAAVIKSNRPEFSFLIALSAVCAAAVYAFVSVAPSLEKLQEVIAENNVPAGYFKTALKALIIAFTAETVADTCRDFGQSAMASKAELAGKCLIFVLTVPLFCSIVDVALSFLEL